MFERVNCGKTKLQSTDIAHGLKQSTTDLVAYAYDRLLGGLAACLPLQPSLLFTSKSSY